MLGLIKAMGIVKAAAAVTALTAATAFTATVALPAAATLGQSHATGAVTATHTPPATSGPSDPSSNAVTPDTSGKDVAALQARLAANKARLLTNLGNVLAALQADPNANPRAISALEAVIARIENGSTGLNRASGAVAGQVGQANAPTPTLPAQAQSHPTPGSQPTPPSHPTSTSHPGKP